MAPLVARESANIGVRKRALVKSRSQASELLGEGRRVKEDAAGGFENRETAGKRAGPRLPRRCGGRVDAKDARPPHDGGPVCGAIRSSLGRQAAQEDARGRHRGDPGVGHGPFVKILHRNAVKASF